MTNSQPGPIRRVFGFFGRAITWLRVVVLNGIFLVLLILIISSIVNNQPEPLPAKGPLLVNISGFLVDQRSYMDPVAEIISQGQGGNAETVVRDVIRAIHYAANDDNVSELILDVKNFTGGGISKLEEIGEALAGFKESGKKITAVSNSYTQAQYYLASYADQVYLHPMGSVLLTGFGSYRNYFQEGLENSM